MKDKTKVYIYTRVSTAMQIDGYSLDAQKSRMRAFAEYNDFEIVGEYEDAGKSGKSIEGRSSFIQMMNDIKTGKDEISYVLVFKLSRFGRNAADVLNTLQDMQDFGVNLICVEDGIDSSKDAGKLMISVLSAVAEIERENIRVQTMEGRIQKAREGKWNGGFPPYGYKLVDGKLIINETEAEAIRQIYHLYINTTMGTGRIAKYLEEHGIYKLQRHNGTNPLFSSVLIRRILSNPIYAGKIAYGRRRTEKVRGTRNEYHLVHPDDYILVDGLHEAIVSEEDWDRAQIKVESQKKHHDRVDSDKQNIYLLSGILRCPVCGAGMYSNYTTKKSRDGTKNYVFSYYTCKHSKHVRGHRCDFKTQIKQKLVDDAIGEILVSLISNERFSELLQSKINLKIDTAEMRKEIKELEKVLKKFYATKTKIINEIDSLDPDDRHYDRMKSDLNERLYTVYDKISEQEDCLIQKRKKLITVEAEQISGENIYKVLRDFGGVYDLMTPGEKRKLVELLIDEINIFKERQPDGKWIKSIKFKLPMIPQNISLSQENSGTVETVVLLEHKI